MLKFRDFIQVSVFTTNHHYKILYVMWNMQSVTSYKNCLTKVTRMCLN